MMAAMHHTEKPMLQIEHYALAYGAQQALDDVSLFIKHGEVLGLVGESGSGKSSLAWAIMRYLPDNSVENDGKIILAGRDLRQMSQKDLNDVRGRQISMVFQDPGTSLNPTLSLGRQLSEVLIRHRGLTKKQAWAQSIERLAQVGLKNPQQMMQRLPHEVSGGEKQRVVIACAFACNPQCIIFDEPTTALDIITAHQILDLVAELQRSVGIAALYISHDLRLVSRISDRIAVMQRGVLVQQSNAAALFQQCSHPYTCALIDALPDPHRYLAGPAPTPEAAPMIAARNISVTYGHRSFFHGITHQENNNVIGNHAIHIEIRPGEILGVIGESGSGKSTLARALTGLNKFSGEILFEGKTITRPSDMDMRYRKAVQIIFQHPDASLNPRQTIRQILTRPLRIYGQTDDALRIEDMLADVQLPAELADRYPHQLSGGQKQRVAIARAFAARPQLVICDEITSSLDVSVQALIMRLLIDLQKRYDTAYLFITHDLNLIRQMAHRVTVMYRGQQIETIPVHALDAPERAPYTRALMARADWQKNVDRFDHAPY